MWTTGCPLLQEFGDVFVKEVPQGLLPWRNLQHVIDFQPELAKLETLDCGKPLDETAWGLDDVTSCLEYYADLAESLDGKQRAPVSVPLQTFKSYVIKEPIGIIGLITPWNYPQLMATWKVAPALAAGCTAVLKPSELASVTCLEIAIEGYFWTAFEGCWLEFSREVGLPLRGDWWLIWGHGNKKMEALEASIEESSRKKTKTLVDVTVLDMIQYKKEQLVFVLKPCERMHAHWTVAIVSNDTIVKPEIAWKWLKENWSYISNTWRGFLITRFVSSIVSVFSSKGKVDEIEEFVTSQVTPTIYGDLN